jgi:predicted nuclease of predicted toxin-antitoxin system
MKLWLDAQLSPQLASWMSIHFAVEASAVRDLGLRQTLILLSYLNNMAPHHK